MKKIISILILAALFASSVQAQVNWNTIEQASNVDTKSNKKPFFIDIYTTWCGHCKTMDRETFSDPVVAAILNKYYIPVKFDAEGVSSFTWNGTKYSNTRTPGQNAQVHPFTRAILGPKLGYPAFAIFNKDKGLSKIQYGRQNAYDFSMFLWYYCSGDDQRYTYDEYQQIFQTEIKPDMMKKLGLNK